MMSLADKTIDAKIYHSAQEEFLAKGFLKASVRQICAKAGVTTGALYKRFPGKEALFQALVHDVIDDINRVVAEKSMDYSDPSVTDRQLYDMWTLTEGYLQWWYRFLYERKEGFTLLVKCAEGTKYQDFKHELVERICSETYRCYEAALERGLVRDDISRRELHVLSTSFWSTMFEPFIHDFTKAEIDLHCELTTKFIDWHEVLGFQKPQS